MCCYASSSERGIVDGSLRYVAAAQHLRYLSHTLLVCKVSHRRHRAFCRLCLRHLIVVGSGCCNLRQSGLCRSPACGHRPYRA